MRRYVLDAGEPLDRTLVASVVPYFSALRAHRASIALDPNAIRIDLPGTNTTALRILLDALTAIDRWQLGRLVLPSIYAAGVRYAREPKGREWWQAPLVSVRQRSADCEDLACWRTAELQRDGIRAIADIITQRTRRGTLYHIVVRYPDGTIEDPSERLGM